MTDKTNRKIAFICSKGNLDMAYPALIMGWAALGNGIDVTIFFTFWGMDMITQGRASTTWRSPPVANTSMKMSMMGVPGNLGIPNIMGVLPGMTAFATTLMKSKMKAWTCRRCANTCRCWWMLAPSCTPARCRCDMFELKKEDFIDGVETSSPPATSWT